MFPARSSHPLLLLLLLLGVFSVGMAYLRQGEAPIRQAWSIQVPMKIDDETPIPNQLMNQPGVPPLLTILVARSGWLQSRLLGVALADGSVLWNTSGVEVTYENQNYTLPYVAASLFGPSGVVADYYLLTGNDELLTWQGFAIIDYKTGRRVMNQDTEPDSTSLTLALNKWGYLYIVKWGKGQNQLMRLEAPDYNPDRPAATLTFPGGGFHSPFPSLWVSERLGLLVHRFNVLNATEGRQGMTLQCLEPRSLKPLWRIENLDPSLSVDIISPLEDVVVLTNSTESLPAVTELIGLSLVSGKELFRWRRDWSTPTSVSFFFLGTAVDRSTGQQRICTKQSAWFSDQRTWVTCIDPNTNRITLNATLDSSGSFMAIYDRWALVKDESTGSLLALDCFTNGEGLHSPAWVLPDQRNMLTLSVSTDGYEFLIAVGKQGRITRWSRL